MQPKKLNLKLSTTFFAVSLLTSCAGTQELNIERVPTSQESATQVGTNGQLISIQSDNVAAAGYDSKSLVMTVQFKNGAMYEYYGVPAELWNSFIAAQPHPWSLVGYPRLVQAGIAYKRIA